MVLRVHGPTFDDECAANIFQKREQIPISCSVAVYNGSQVFCMAGNPIGDGSWLIEAQAFRQARFVCQLVPDRRNWPGSKPLSWNTKSPISKCGEAAVNTVQEFRLVQSSRQKTNNPLPLDNRIYLPGEERLLGSMTRMGKHRLSLTLHGNPKKSPNNRAVSSHFTQISQKSVDILSAFGSAVRM